MQNIIITAFQGGSQNKGTVLSAVNSCIKSIRYDTELVNGKEKAESLPVLDINVMSMWKEKN